MKRYSTLMVACGALAFAGCLVGEVEDVQPGPGNTPGGNIPGATPDAAPINTPDPGDQNPEAIFTAQVAIAVNQACSPGGACHSTQAPAFIAAEQAAAYTTIKNYRDQLFLGYDPATSRLLINGNGTHYNATFDQTAIDAIALWLAAEKQAVDAGGGEEPSPLALWSGCMNLEDWQAAGVADAWADKGTGQGNCDACHNLGADGFMASNQDARVFNTITTSPAFMPSYFTLDAAGTGVMINRPRFEAVANGTPPHQAHPRFNVDGDAMNRLQNFYNTTLQRQANDQCEAPRFVQ